MRLVLIASVLFAGVAHAQGALALDSLHASDYEEAAARLRAGDTDVDYQKARFAFALTDGYSPYDVEPRKRSRRVRDFLNAGDPAAAVLAIDSTLAVDYVDLDAHFWASTAHDRLGAADRSAHHAAVFGGLLRSILDSNRGTEADPYVVLTVAEEYVVVGVLGLAQRGQGLAPCGLAQCDLLSLVDPASGVERELYFDVSIPYGHMQRQLDRR